MSECVVRMEMPKEGCHMCDARCVSALYGYICGIERKNVMPFLGKKNRPDWCPIICQLPEGHGRLVDAHELFYNMFVMTDGRVLPNYDCDNFHIDMHVKDIKRYIRETPTIVPAERSDA